MKKPLFKSGKIILFYFNQLKQKDGPGKKKEKTKQWKSA